MNRPTINGPEIYPLFQFVIICCCYIIVVRTQRNFVIRTSRNSVFTSFDLSDFATELRAVDASVCLFNSDTTKILSIVLYRLNAENVLSFKLKINGFVVSEFQTTAMQVLPAKTVLNTVDGRTGDVSSL